LSSLPIIVASLDDVSSAASRKIIVTGDLVYCSLKPDLDTPGFLPQPPIVAERGLVARIRPDSRKVHLVLKQEVSDMQGIRIAYAIEGYIAWGLRQSDEGLKVLIGGSECHGECNVSVCVFSSGRLLSIEERRLPLPGSLQWEDSVRALLASITESYPSASIFQADPLPDWGIAEVRHLGAEPLKGLRYRSTRTGKLPPLFVAVPLSLLAVGTLAYAGVVGLGYYTYQEQVEQYQVAASNPVILQYGGLDEDTLASLRKKEALLKAARPTHALAPHAARLTAQLSETDGLTLLELRFPVTTNKDKNEPTADFLLSVSVVPTSATLIDQAKEVMGKISDRTGLTLRLVNRSDGQGAKARVLNMEALLSDFDKKGGRP
jgi:hypothetical protein